MHSLFQKITHKAWQRFRARRERNAERRMRKTSPEVFEAVTTYHRNLGEGSLRKNWIKYEALYRFIRDKKPKEVLECGAGTSTVVIVHALMENERECTYSLQRARVTSLEESPKYHARTVGAFPAYLKEYAEILLSPKVEDYYQLFRGVKYKDVPDRPYELVFVDGPTTGAPSDEHKTFDFDFLNVVSRSDTPVYGIVDLRLSGMWVYEHVFGRKQVNLDKGRSLGLVGPVSKKDMRDTDTIVAGHAFRPAFWKRRWF